MSKGGVVDRGRQSQSLNLKDRRAVEVVLRLVESADILVEGFRPGVTERLGFGPVPCHGRNPKLVYGRMSGWGQTGPLAQAADHEINYILLTGALHADGTAAQPVLPLNLVGDCGGGGMLLVVGVLAAYTQAQQTGVGQIVDAATTDGAAYFYGSDECADGKHVSVGAIEPQFYRELLRLTNITDPHFEHQWARCEWPALRAKLAQVLRTRTQAQWCALLEGSDACFAPVLSMDEAIDHPPSVLPSKAPRTGEHTGKLLEAAGYSASEIEDLVHSGAAFDGANA